MKHIVGATLLFISCIFYCCPYICTAIYLSNSNTYSEELFHSTMQCIGGHFTQISILSFVLGVIIILWAERNRRTGIHK